jgi:hypothetical protein
MIRLRLNLTQNLNQRNARRVHGKRRGVGQLRHRQGWVPLENNSFDVRKNNLRNLIVEDFSSVRPASAK